MVKIHFSISAATFNLLNTGGLFHSYILDESIWQFGGVRYILLLLFYFDGKSC